jgi:hypothetical protein
MKPFYFKPILLITTVLLMLNNVTLAQNPTVTGKVVNEANRPLKNASVKLLGVNNKIILATATDSLGIFKLISSSIVEKLVVSYSGYENLVVALKGEIGKDLGVLVVKPTSVKLAEVVVQAKQNPIELDGNTLIFNVAKSISAQGTNALEVLKKAPGVFVDNNESISLNGKSGAMILLDGKQTYLSSKEIADLLRSMPSSQIRTIEIVNSPSAKYDAAGTAGIINIRTTKSQLKGFNGNIGTSLVYGVTLKQTQDLSFNYRKNKVNLFGGYNHFFGHYKYLYGSNRIQNAQNYISDTDDTDKRKRMGSRLGMDYSVDPKNTIGLLLTGNFIFGGGITDTHTDLIDQQQNLDAYNDYYAQATQRYNVNLNYKFEDTLGNLLNIDADYGYYQKDAGNLQSNRYTTNQDQLLKENLYRTLNGAVINLRAIKLDYAVNLWKGKFETGAKYSSIQTANDVRFFHVLANSEQLDDQRSNRFKFEEKIASVYVNYKKTLGNWVVQAGLRLENTASIGALSYQLSGVANSNSIDRNYLNLFPSASASIKLAKNHNLSLGYARRIDRPAYQDLNPFVYLLDELSFFSGNPFLKPQMSHRLNFLYAFKGSTIVGLNYSYATNFKANITDSIDINKIVMVPRNVGNQHHLALTLTQQITATKWWSLTLNGTLYHLQNQLELDQARNFELKQTAAKISLQQGFKLPYKFSAEIFTLYNSKRLNGANEVVRPTSQFDIGLQRSLLKDRATIRFVYSDVYKGTKSSSVQSYGAFYLRNYSYYETRQIRLNFSYKFADASVKGPRNRNSALENENGRIK